MLSLSDASQSVIFLVTASKPPVSGTALRNTFVTKTSCSGTTPRSDSGSAQAVSSDTIARAKVAADEL